MTGDVAVVLAPGTVDELRAAMLGGYRRLLVRGAGTASEWGGRPEPVDAVLDVSGLDRLLGYQPTDLTVTVQAGMPLLELQRVLAEQGQRVALDAGRIPHGATVGGLLATGDAGPGRHLYGTLRDTVIGVTMVLADGTVAHSGGQVIKNVAGYDLAKVLHGSLGTLAVLAELVLRVRPLPAAGRTVRVSCPIGVGFALAGRLMAGALEPAAVEWSAGRLLVRFEGTATGVDARVAAALRVAGADASAGDDASARDDASAGDDASARDDASACDDESAAALWREVGELAVGAAGDTVLRVGTRPDRAAWVADRVTELAGRHGIAVELASSLGVGVHTVRLRGGDPAAQATLVAQLRAELAGVGASTVLCRHPEQVPAWGDAPPAVALLRAVKHQFDPDGRLGPGRFAPWW